MLIHVACTTVVCLGNRDGALVRALASHQCGPGSIPAQCHMWGAFVVGSYLASRVFAGFSVFFPRKNQQSEQDRKQP